MRYSVSDYGDMTLSVASTTPRASGTSPDTRRRKKAQPSTIRKRRISLSDLIERVVPRRESFSTGPEAALESIWSAKSNYARDIRMLYKRRITTLYNTAVDLRSYAELNYSGFRKILKKYVYSPNRFFLRLNFL